jgi:hypothetical protein
MKINKFIASSIAIIAFAGVSQAATINISVEALSDGIASFGGTALPSGTNIGVGFFTVDGTPSGTVLSDIDIANLATGSALDAAFVEFGAGEFEVGAGAGLDGAVSDQFAGDNAGFNGKTIYAYFNTGTELGVFKNLVGANALTFPSGADITSDSATFGFDRANRLPDAAIIIGSFDAGNVNSNLGGGGSFELAQAVPEPSSALLLFGSVALMITRRRRA